MSYDLMIWKQKSEAAGVPATEICESLCADTAHHAITRFDAREFESALVNAFGNIEGMYEIADFTGVAGNWISFFLSYSRVEGMVPKLHEMAAARGLTIFDFQDEDQG
jgi:hypothetical protein